MVMGDLDRGGLMVMIREPVVRVQSQSSGQNQKGAQDQDQWQWKGLHPDMLARCGEKANGQADEPTRRAACLMRCRATGQLTRPNKLSRLSEVRTASLF